jgi:hypothetical protein
MSRVEPTDDLVHKLGELGKMAVPLEDSQRAQYRRERLVRRLGTQIQANSRRSRWSRRWVWVATVAAAAAGGIVGFQTFHHGPAVQAAVSTRAEAGETHTVLGDVFVRRGNVASTLRVGDVLVGGEVVSTAERAGVEIGIASGRADLAAASELEIVAPTATERRLRLGRGSVDVDLPHKLESGKHLVVETPDVDVLVVGTAFTVEVGQENGARATHVSVRRGTVWIMQNGQQRAVLHAGDDWRTPAAKAAALSEPAPVRTRSVGSRGAVTRAGGTPRVVPSARPVDSGTLAEENRLFQAGLTARNAGDAAAAADAFASLLSRYPRSVLREQALAGEFRALERAGRSSAATVAARRYLAGYPSGFAHVDAERVANSLASDR